MAIELAVKNVLCNEIITEQLLKDYELLNAENNFNNCLHFVP